MHVKAGTNKAFSLLPTALPCPSLSPLTLTTSSQPPEKGRLCQEELVFVSTEAPQGRLKQSLPGPPKAQIYHLNLTK